MADASTVIGPEPTEPADWSELWERGEMVHHATGSLLPFLGPVQLRAFESDAQRRNAEKYLLARVTPVDGRPTRSFFVLAVPKLKHVEHFVTASKGVWGGTPGRRLLGSIGLLHANRTRVGWRVDFVQAHYNNTSEFPLKRSVATLYAGWANRAMHTLAEHVRSEGARLAYYGVTWVERERFVECAQDPRDPTSGSGSTEEHTEKILVPRYAHSLSHFGCAFRAGGYRVVHLGGSKPFRGKRSVLLAFR